MTNSAHLYPKRGGPHRDTQLTRTAATINAAMRALRKGYAEASAEVVAAEAGVSTRACFAASRPNRAASRNSRQMICSDQHESLLFGGEAAVARLDCTSHVEHVIDIFLLGATPRK